MYRPRWVCGGAFIGAGKVTAEITFPEQPFFNANGPLMIFNGVSTHGRHALLMYVFAEVPVPSTYVTEVSVTERPSGPVLTAKLPTIDGGYGHISSFDLSLGRKFQAGGRAQSFLSLAARRPGALPGASYTFARASYSFAGVNSLSKAQSSVTARSEVVDEIWLVSQTSCTNSPPAKAFGPVDAARDQEVGIQLGIAQLDALPDQVLHHRGGWSGIQPPPASLVPQVNDDRRQDGKGALHGGGDGDRGAG